MQTINLTALDALFTQTNDDVIILSAGRAPFLNSLAESLSLTMIVREAFEFTMLPANDWHGPRTQGKAQHQAYREVQDRRPVARRNQWVACRY